MENTQYDGAVRVIENCAGFTDITTSAGEAWEVVQEEVSALRATVVKLEADVVSLREAAVHIYNSGYSAGHHYTVEGSYVAIHSSDMDSYHAEDVAELLAALVEEEWK